MSDIYLWTDGFKNILYILALLVFLFILFWLTHPFAEKTENKLYQAFKIDFLMLLISLISCFYIASQYSMEDMWAYLIFKIFTETQYVAYAIIILTFCTIVETESRRQIKWWHLGLVGVIILFVIEFFITFL